MESQRDVVRRDLRNTIRARLELNESLTSHESFSSRNPAYTAAVRECLLKHAYNLRQSEKRRVKEQVVKTTFV